MSIKLFETFSEIPENTICTVITPGEDSMEIKITNIKDGEVENENTFSILPSATDETINVSEKVFIEEKLAESPIVESIVSVNSSNSALNSVAAELEHSKSEDNYAQPNYSTDEYSEYAEESDYDEDLFEE